MRPIARPQSLIRAPLNAVLGTGANVRLVRVLSQTSAPMAPSDLASAAMLNLSGAVRALSALEELGIVERVGTGRRQQVIFRHQHPLAPALVNLFAAERERFQGLLDRLKEISAQLSPPPKSVWIEGAVAEEKDRLGTPLRLALLTTAKDVDRSVATMEVESGDIQRDRDVTIEVRGLTEVDLVALPPGAIQELQHALPVFGPPPVYFLGGGKRRPARRTHADIDADSRALARAIARQLKRDPSIAQRASDYIQMRLSNASPGERHELRTWNELLNSASPARLRQFLVDPGERATRLRQTMPFLAALTPEERARVYRDAARPRRKSKKKL